MTSWDDQRAFLAVLDEGSLSGAARLLGVTQPTVRARIEALEHALGARLFTRSVHGLAPTEQARALGASARAMAHASAAFVRAAFDGLQEAAGTVRLSVSEFVGVEVLPPMLTRLHALHPRIQIELELSNAPADLLDQAVDIAVRMHAPRHEALVARKVTPIPLGLFASRDYLAERGAPCVADDLAGHRFIGPDRNKADRALAATILPSSVLPDFVLRTDSHPAALSAARAGLGIAVVHRPVGLADPLLLPVFPDRVVATLQTWIVTHEDLRTLPRISAVFEYLVEAFDAYARNEGPQLSKVAS